MPFDRSLPDPNNPTNLAQDDRRGRPPASGLDRHPRVRRLLWEIKLLKVANQQLLDRQLEMLNRDLLVKRNLEPLNPVPPGIIEPVSTGPTIIHVDNLRLIQNRVTGRRDPTVRILVGGPQAVPVHCYELRLLGPSDLQETYDFPLPKRPSAIVVLYTRSPIEVLR